MLRACGYRPKLHIVINARIVWQVRQRRLPAGNLETALARIAQPHLIKVQTGGILGHQLLRRAAVEARRDAQIFKRRINPDNVLVKYRGTSRYARREGDKPAQTKQAKFQLALNCVPMPRPARDAASGMTSNSISSKMT